ncbi:MULTISPECIES: S1 domain-containing RNA-binding protein [unclassified Enterococcus]|uniref:S1 domain-containing RNA-binding protein n=1 Tax=unclassified Enterococcus TaxID=2608891 RepID=UPI0015565005|nr:MULTISPECIES: S1 domain-containing RNA-binding protein [unclassified Enterococcus]MBS7578277.1 RNA-binding protein S1 [Enterococcus sp. MMGLQ5-2]MBS7585457.1 RNA-binding protein S1 [Enterococcus sp. MMGLQ5-1]NPD13314.1 RNA-binding protein S1 [Enterococcus sp. MMGLQ5-1]NPD38108.1 RNA-binding protein S1 [Enterococcus sp. MMGLQ5-2]
MSIEVGQKLQGKVTGITNFGAFIDLGEGKSGLVHISQVSNDFINNINDILSVGDVVTVKVMQIADDGKISLSIKQAMDKPAQSQRTEAPKVEREPVEFKKDPKKYAKDGTELSEFDLMMKGFLRQSEEHLVAIKRSREGKRGGRGGRKK